MKGISAVIATILLLLIVIAIVGFAFGFFQRLFTTTAGATETQVGATLNQTAQAVRVENAAGTAVSLRNVGTAVLSTGTLSFYAGGQLRTCAFAPNPTTIAPNAVANCTLSGASCTGQTLRVTTAGGEDSVDCA